MGEETHGGRLTTKRRGGGCLEIHKQAQLFWGGGEKARCPYGPMGWEAYRRSYLQQV